MVADFVFFVFFSFSLLVVHSRKSNAFEWIRIAHITLLLY